MIAATLKRIRRSQRSLGLLLAGLGMFLVSTDSLFTRIANIDGWTVSFLVGLWSIPVTFTLATHQLWGRLRTEVAYFYRPLLISASLSAVATSSFIQAITLTEVANVVAIIAAAPIFASLVARMALGEQASMRTWRGILAAASGILVIVGGSLSGSGIGGDLLAMLSVAAFSINLVIWRRHGKMPRTLVVACSSTFLVVFTAIPAQPLTIDAKALTATLIMGAAFGPAARLCMTTAPRYAPAAEVSLFVPIETVFASLWVWLWFGEAPPTTTFFGGALVVAAVIYGVTGRSSPKTLVPESPARGLL